VFNPKHGFWIIHPDAVISAVCIRRKFGKWIIISVSVSFHSSGFAKGSHLSIANGVSILLTQLQPNRCAHLCLIHPEFAASVAKALRRISNIALIADSGSEFFAAVFELHLANLGTER
jgi:hypothetical protein